MLEVMQFITTTLYKFYYTLDQFILWESESGLDVSLFNIIVGFIALRIIISLAMTSKGGSSD